MVDSRRKRDDERVGGLRPALRTLCKRCWHKGAERAELTCVEKCGRRRCPVALGSDPTLSALLSDVYGRKEDALG